LAGEGSGVFSGKSAGASGAAVPLPLAAGGLIAISGVDEGRAPSFAVGERTASVVATAVNATRATAPPINAAGREKTLCVAMGSLTADGVVGFMGGLLRLFLQPPLNATEASRSFTKRFQLRPNVSLPALLRSPHADETGGS
jgi:hypothetical protein